MENIPVSDNIGLFDLDGSLADYDKALLEGLEELRGPDEPLMKSVSAAFDQPHLKARIDLICKQPDWWLNLEPIEMGFQIMELAKEIGFQIHVLTQGPKTKPRAWKEKVEWCRKHLGSEIDIHITRNKGMVYGKFLYDDYPEYMMRWLQHRPRGLGIMPVNEDNKDFRHPQVVRWNGDNIDEIQDSLQAAFNRRRGQALVSRT